MDTTNTQSYWKLLAEIKSEENYERYRTLSYDEERALIDSIDDVTELRQTLIEHNIPLVLRECRKYEKYVDMDDLFGNAMVGLAMAANKFDINKGTKFSTVAYWWIKKMVYSIYDKSNRQYDSKTNGTVYSLNTPVTDDAGDSDLDAELSDSPIKNPLDDANNRDVSALFYNIIEDAMDVIPLTDNELGILSMKYMYDMNQADIARELGVTSPYVSQMHKNLIGKLNRHVKNKYAITTIGEIIND